MLTKREPLSQLSSVSQSHSGAKDVDLSPRNWSSNPARKRTTQKISFKCQVGLGIVTGVKDLQHWCVEVLFLLPTAYITTLSQSTSSTSNGRDFLAYRFFRQSTMLALIPTANLTVIWQRHGKQVKKWMLTQRNAGYVAWYPLKRAFFNLFFSVFMFLLVDWCIAAIWMTVLKTAVFICCACEEVQRFLFWDVIQAALSASWSTLLWLFLPFRVALPCVQNPSKLAFSGSAYASRAVVLWGTLPLQRWPPPPHPVK